MKLQEVGGKCIVRSFINCTCPPVIIGMVKSKRMALVEHVARMWSREVLIVLWWRSKKARYQNEDVHIGGRVTLRWILER
jgi:hypothetical protein